MRRSTLAALAALALLALVPLAAADHSYSHRYVLFGRVVDAEGNPVSNVTVDATGDRSIFSSGTCSPNSGGDSETDAYGPTIYDPQTDEHGDFVLCLHVHELPEGTDVRLSVRDVEGFETTTFTVDGRFRSDWVLLQLPAGARAGDPAPIERAYTVLGRAWEATENGSVVLEQVPVNGTTVDQTPVEIRLLSPEGAVVGTASTTTNGYGDFAVRVPVTERFVDGQVEVVVGAKTFTAPATGLGITPLKAQMGEVPPPTPPTVDDFPSAPSPTPRSGGVQEDTTSSTPTPTGGASRTPALALPAVALALVVAALARRSA